MGKVSYVRAGVPPVRIGCTLKDFFDWVAVVSKKDWSV